ncbi:MAG: Gfo/Idh/MocA family oxidoreductase [Oscillochloris sp.]|nr:Gfo/Idh/MocA family oxidoreductase [Oscillochloris sp.]
MTKQYRVAIVGTGRVGALWETDPPSGISHAGAFALLPECTLVAGVNRGRARLEEFGRRFGVTALYGDYETMLGEVRPDILCVATHPGSHAAIVEAAVAAGVRAIFCEKPLALDMADTDRIIDACNAGGVLLSVNHSRRWYPAYRQARELLHAGAIGELVALTGYCQGGKPAPSWQSELEGPLLHDATHLFDMLRYFAGDARWVAATAQRRRHTQYPVEDDSSALIGFDQGVTAITQVNELSAYTRFEVELHGSNGAMRLGNDGSWIGRPRPIVIEQPPAEHPEFEWQRLEWQPLEFENGPPAFLQAARELLAALEGKSGLCSTGADGRASMEIIEAIYASQLRGNLPVALPLASDSSALVDLAESAGWR